MITGSMTNNLEAEVRLRVRRATSGEDVIIVIVDTGFNDFLTLPPPLIDDLDLEPGVPTEATLADGSSVTMRSFYATIIWHDEPREILVLESEGDVIAGMALMEGSDLFMRVIPGGSVRIEKIT